MTQTYLLICVILFFAGLTQGISGFGSVLLALPLLALFLDIKTVIPLATLAALSMTVIILIQLRSHLEWAKFRPLLAGAIPGIPVGVLLLKRLDRSVIELILGSILLVFSLYGLFFKEREKKSLHRSWAYLSGFFAGCLGGSVAAIGPPIIIYSSFQPWKKDQVKVTMQGFFLAAELIIVVCQALSGLTTPTVVKFYLAALPALTLGTITGSYLYGFVKEEFYTKILLVMLLLLGGFMIFQA